MVWHAIEQKKDGKPRHPADAKAWQTMDAKFPHLSEYRNMRLGVAIDGFNPSHTMNSMHSTWPIPLIEELKELWKTGVEMYDAATNQVFTLRASVLWTIRDFPDYAMLSGWSTKGKLAYANHKWRSDKRRFNGEVEAGTSALMLTGSQVAEILDGYENSLGGVGRKRKVSCDVNPWNKSVLETLLNIGGKTKDHLEARLDLKDLGIRKAFHPTTPADGKHLEIRAAKFDMTNKEKDIICSVLEKAKFPYGFASNISKFLNDGENKSMNEAPTSNAEKGGYPISLGKSKTGKDINLLEDTGIMAHRKHHTVMDNNAQSKRYKRERAHMDEVCDWFRDEIRKKTNVSRELSLLAKGPRREAKRFSGYVVNGYRFHTKQRDRKCTIQNSGVYSTALTTSFASAKDSDPSVGEVSYYGSIEDILEIDYWGAFRVVSFKCAWMDSDKVTIRLHHMGNFMKTRYVGDKCEVYDVERDYFSYSVLMEFVKDIKDNEIGGVYIKQRGWKLVTDDRVKQMQPHVIVRPKSSPFKVKETNVNSEKRTFMTLQNINADKTRRMKYMNAKKKRRSVVARKKLQYSKEDVNREIVEPSQKAVVNDVDGSGTGAGQAGLVESGRSKETVNPVEGEGCNEYEMRKNKNIAKYKEKLAALGLVQTKLSSEKTKKKLKQANEDTGESDYLPSNYPARESENEEDDNVTSKKYKKTKRQRVIPGSTNGGPRTRGQAVKLVDDSQNKEATLESLPAEKNDAPVPTTKERLQYLKSGPGSMVAIINYENVRNYEFRRRSRRKSLEHNKYCLNQDKFIILEEAKSWVFITMSDQFRSNKSRINRYYYTKYATDEERLKHSCSKKVDKLPIGIDDNEAEELLKISDADVYLETRKRDAKRMYKIPDEMADEVNEKIAKVQKVLQTEGAEAANKLVHGNKERTPSYLIGRLVHKK
ncbi:hypothetical protein AgCh_012679 [Apium graveolens]